MAKEAESLLEVTEKFVQLYVFRITSHSFHSVAGNSGTGISTSRTDRSGIKRSASDADLRGDHEDDERRKQQGGQGGDGSSDPLDFQWPFMSGFPTTAQNGSASTANAAAGNGTQSHPSSSGVTSTPTNPMAQQHIHHGNPAEKHPALANAQALARALYLVKMQVQSIDVRL